MAKKVLIIEDSPDISGSLKILIELEGYEAIIAGSGFEGLDKALNEKPDLILMDISLPDMDGIDITRQIRSNTETAETPILCVSSYTRGIEDEVMKAGCNEIFSKTTFMTSFSETLEKYLGEGSKARSKEADRSTCSTS